MKGTCPERGGVKKFLTCPQRGGKDPKGSGEELKQPLSGNDDEHDNGGLQKNDQLLGGDLERGECHAQPGGLFTFWNRDSSRFKGGGVTLTIKKVNSYLRIVTVS